MQTATRTFQITLPVSDAPFLRRLSGNMGWDVSLKRSDNICPKVKMTEQEFRDKLLRSSQQALEGKTIRMRADETAENFVNRLLCM